MGHWTKFYNNGTKYTGTDTAIARGQASWRKSKNNGIVKVVLEHNDLTLSISGIGEYWQSDEWEAEFPSGKPTMTKRRIMKKVEQYDQIACIRKSLTSYSLRFDAYTPKAGETPKITNEALIGQWAVVEMDLINHNVYSYFSRKKV